MHYLWIFFTSSHNASSDSTEMNAPEWGDAS